MDEAFIVVSVISGVFGILGLLILDRNWFRREHFKFEMGVEKQKADLNFKKMRKDLGLDVKGPAFQPTAPTSLLGNAAPLLELAKNLNPDQLGMIVDLLGGGGGREEEPEGLPGGIDGLLEFAAKNPDLVQGFLKGMPKPQLPGGGENLY